MRFFFRHKVYPHVRHAHRPIFCTQRFTEDIRRIYGNISRTDDEASAYAHVIAGSAIFYKCEELPESTMMRRRASVSTRMDTPEVRKMFIDELKQTQGRSRHVSIHDHPMNYPYLSACDIRTYERCRTSEAEPSPFGRDKPYPVVLINLAANAEIELLGFWVNDGCAQRTTINVIPDESEIVSAAWDRAPKLAYFSPEAELARKIGGSIPEGWTVVLGVNDVTRQKALLVTNPEGLNKVLPFSNSPLGLNAPDFWKYVDWPRLFVDCFTETKDGAPSAQEPMETKQTATGENNEQDNRDNPGTSAA